MIATGLTFLLGVLLTALFALLIAPIIWRKAQKLARRDYEATIPTSANEIRAEFDRVRAEAALSIRRQEILTAKANEKSARTQAELGRGTVENVEILRKVRALTQTVEERDAEIARLTDDLARKTAEAEQLTTDLATARHEAGLTAEELEALGVRFLDLGEIAEERKIQLIAAEAKNDSFADAGRLAERRQRENQDVIDRLKGELAAAERLATEEKAALVDLRIRLDAMVGSLADRDEEIAGLQLRTAQTASGKPLVLPVPAAALAGGQRLRAALDKQKGAVDDTAGIESPSDADVRETISDLAARVIRIAALAEGPQSPLAGLLDAKTSAGSDAGLSLADRVRLLVEAERGGARPERPASQAGRPE